MMRPPNRLPEHAGHGFGGSELNRERPLQFLLNDQRIDGFAGDTVLSAALASGVDTIGTLDGSAVALDELCGPLVREIAAAGPALPMAQVPARHGLELTTLDAGRHGGGAWGWLQRLRGSRRSLDLDFENTLADILPSTSRVELYADLAIIGGGIAGLSAARAAASSGHKVILVERRAWLGGDAAFFGAIDDDENPVDTIARLSAELSGSPDVTLLLRTEALHVAGTDVLAFQVEALPDRATGRTVRVRAKRIIVATGSVERLPIFSGNRLPGIVGSVAAFHRAARYGVWRNGSSLFATQNNYAYRLALRAHDAGVNIVRVTDSRLNPQSRFIDFSKAQGFTIAAGLAPLSAEMTRSPEGALAIRFSVGFAEIDRFTAPLRTEQFVVAGGWQPDLTLWIRAGGKCRWHAKNQRIEVDGTLADIALAGAAAGYLNTSACQMSGVAALTYLLGGAVQDIDDSQINAAFETPPGPTPLAPAEASLAPAYLEGGCNFARRKAVASASWFGRAVPSPAEPEPHGRGLVEIAARVQLGEISALDADILTCERAGVSGTPVTARPQPPTPAEMQFSVPAYLGGRFGTRPVLAIVAVDATRVFDVGALIFPNASRHGPLDAIGVIVARAPKGEAGGLALLKNFPTGEHKRIVIMEAVGPVPITRLEPYRPEK